MKTTLSRTSCTTLALAGALTLPALARAQTTPELGNYIEFGAGAAVVDGDAASFQSRSFVARKGFGGVSDFLFTSKDGKLSVEGHGLTGVEDYFLRLAYAPTEKLALEVGYRSFRTWYDGSGGYVSYAKNFAGGASRIDYTNPFYALDRRQLYVSAAFKPTEQFELNLKYTHNIREGEKDSTSQADSNLTFIPQVTGTSNGPTRSIAPSFYSIDEKADVFEADATYTLPTTVLGGAVRWENSQVDNARKERRRPLEAADRYITHRDEADTDMFMVRGSVKHRFTDTLGLSGSYLYTKLDSILEGSRIYGASFDAAFDPVYPRRQPRDEGYYDLENHADIRSKIGQLALSYTPMETLSVVGALRFERETRESIAEFIETNVASSPAGAPAVGVHAEAETSRHWDDATGSVEARYTGLPNWVFVARAEGSKGYGVMEETFEAIYRDTEYHRWTERYGFTANWYPSTKANVSFMYGYRDRYTDYDGIADSTPNTNTSSDRYPAYIKGQSFTTDDYAVRLTLRPFAGVTSVTRVDIQETDVVSTEVGLGTVNGAKLKSNIVSQSLTWSPLARLWLQGSVNYNDEKMDTPADLATGAAAGIVTDTENSYWSSSLSAGYAADDKTDLFLGYDHNTVDNWIDNSRFTTPYGMKSKEDTITATVVRRINANVQVSLKYAYAKYDEPSAGGVNDYTANLVFGKVQYRF